MLQARLNEPGPVGMLLLLFGFSFLSESAVAQHKIFKVAPEGPIYQMALSPNADIVAVTTVRTNLGTAQKAHEDLIVVFDFPNGKRLAEIAIKADRLVFAADGKQLLSYRVIPGSDERMVTLVSFWDIRSGTEAKVLEIKGRGVGMTSKFVFTQDYPGYKYTLATDLETGAATELKNTEYLIQSATASPDGQHFVTVAAKTPTVLWDAKTGKSIFIVETLLGGPVRFFPKETMLALGSDLVEMASGKRIRTTLALPCMAVSADCKLMADYRRESFFDKKTEKIYNFPEAVYVHAREQQDGRKGPILYSFTTHNKKRCSALEFTPDDRFLIAACGDGVIEMWELSKGKFELPK